MKPVDARSIQELMPKGANVEQWREERRGQTVPITEAAASPGKVVAKQRKATLLDTYADVTDRQDFGDPRYLVMVGIHCITSCAAVLEIAQPTHCRACCSWGL